MACPEKEPYPLSPKPDPELVEDFRRLPILFRIQASGFGGLGFGLRDSGVGSRVSGVLFRASHLVNPKHKISYVFRSPEPETTGNQS